ncbi:MAG: hypothetical protein AB8B74_10890 [Crocinitomicaceae bacterium]
MKTKKHSRAKNIVLGLLSIFAITSVNITFAQFNPNGNKLFWNDGQVGIGLSNPTARLDIKASNDFLYSDESLFRITYGIGQANDGLPLVNENIFHIRTQWSPPNGSTVTSSKFVVKTNGNVGIGIQNNDPLLNNQRLVITDKNSSLIDLHVLGMGLFDGRGATAFFGSETGAPYGEFGIQYNDNGDIAGLNFWKPSGSNNFSNYLMFISDAGNVSIGTDNSEGYKLAVKGKMIAEEITVKLHTFWPDFVFTSNYGLMPINEVETFINKNKHLPNVPSAATVQESGINLGEMDAILLQKIEELTLYMIDQNKKIQALQAELDTYKK